MAVTLSGRLHAGDIIYLVGELGAGKTTWVRALLRALGYTGRVKSPTYTWVESYVLPSFTLHHFDWYRLGSPGDVVGLGLADYQTSDALWCVEWPEKAIGFLPKPTWTLTLTVDESGERTLLQKEG